MNARLAGLQVSEREVERAYEEALDTFTRPERVRAALIWIPVPARASESRRASLRARADEALSEFVRRSPGLATVDFGALAVRYSADQATRYRGGDVGWLARRQESRWPAEVVDAVFDLAEIGDVTPVIETTEGLAIARLMDRRPSETQPLAEVAERIRARLLTDARRLEYEAFLSDVRNEVTIERNDALLAASSAPAATRPASVTERRPPPVPGG
jgi:peptidyl-prolyl cis-trans isomerase D